MTSTAAEKNQCLSLRPERVVLNLRRRFGITLQAHEKWRKTRDS